MIRKLFLQPILSSEDRYDRSCVRIPARGLPPLAGAARASSPVPSSAFLLTRRGHPLKSPPAAASPRCPDDCPACRLACTPLLAGGPAPTGVASLARGEKPAGSSSLESTLQASPVPISNACTLGSPMTTSTRLFGDGKHGHAERIQTFRDPACRTTFTSRPNTPLYRLNPPSQQIAMVLSALAEGLDESAAERVAGLSSGDHHHPAHSRGLACTDLTRTLLPSSPDPASPTG
jgi:hypothetical protein